jgi:hypothetical protein
VSRLGRLLLIALTCTSALAARTAAAQVDVEVGAEVARDRSNWHFDNPSTYDTAALVPHYFEQRYTFDNLWLTGSAGYRAGVDWRTTVGVTPVRTALATDYDTFFDPDGTVWTSGTTGDATMHAFRVSQELDLGRAGPLHLSGGYRWRMELADFLAGDKSDTRNGVVVSRSIVTTREYTRGQTHALFIAATADRTLSPGWRLEGRGEVAPAAVNRLAIELPDKYPGQTILFQTTNLSMEGRAALVHTGATWHLTLALHAASTFNYYATQTLDRHSVAVGVSLARTL